jgi:hypothetical protein
MTFDPYPGDWVQSSLNAAARQTAKRKRPFVAPELTVFHRRCLALLSKAFRTGIYNLSVNWEKADWDCGHGICIVMRAGNGLSTWDFDGMTRLVIGAHDECIRVDVEARSRGYFAIYMHPRRRAGGMSVRHPTIETAVADYRRDEPGGWIAAYEEYAA